MEPLFQSAQDQKEFDKDGFVRYPSFISPEKADELLQLYETILDEHNAIGIPFITTSHSNNHELIRKADLMITGILEPAMKKVLRDYKLLFGNFLIKMRGADSETPPHQDITFVDEHSFPSVSVWVALSDNDETNGCMRFLKGSHKFMFTLRPTHEYPWTYEKVRPLIDKHLTSYPCKKGDAFIFHHGVIHASFANLTGKPRVAAVLAAYPENAELIHYFLPRGSKTEVSKYKMTKEAFLHFVKEQPPSLGEFVAVENFEFKQVEAEEFESFFE